MCRKMNINVTHDEKIANRRCVMEDAAFLYEEENSLRPPPAPHQQQNIHRYLPCIFLEYVLNI